MKTHNAYIAAAAILAALCLPSCGNPASPSPSEELCARYAGNVAVVSDDVSGPVVWSAEKVYCVETIVYVLNGATLTIEPGAVVKFGVQGGLYVAAGGAITASGTAEKPIVFTSVRDGVGGDSILDDAPALPAKGDWPNVRTQPGAAGTVFRYCEFRYAGRSKEAALAINGPAVVENCVFRDNLAGLPFNDYEEAALDARDAESGTVIAGNLFYGNTWPLAVPAAMSLDASNSFSYDHDHDPATPPLSNAHQAIYLADATVTGLTVWSETEVPLCLIGSGGLVVDPTATLTVASGVVVKLSGPSTGILLGGGSTMNSSGAVFTSYRDDAKSGDTNGDGKASAPRNGDWYGIWDADLGGDLGDYYPRDNAAGSVRYSANTAAQ